MVFLVNKKIFSATFMVNQIQVTNAKLNHNHVQIPMLPFDVDMLILDTDYDTYMSLYSCIDFALPILPPKKLELGWVFTRERNPSKDVVKLLKIKVMVEVIR